VITCLLGVNGAGKTTLLKTISGVVEDEDGKITHGSLFFREKDISGLRPSEIVSLGIGHAPQDRHVFHTLSVRDNLLLGSFVNRKGNNGKKFINQRMEDVCGLFPVLKQRMNQKSGTLSGGEQQMLSIGRALMSNPRLLLLDEPFLGLAPIIINQIKRSLLMLKKKEFSILLAEQDIKSALSIADKGYVMDEGYIVIGGDAEELLNSSKIKEVYFGEEI
jgi:branched-chain amino acid transport system ATP-binding protein